MDTLPVGPRPFDLYRFYDEAGVLLYVGISLTTVQRMMQHRDRQPWWHEVDRMDIEHLATIDRREAERLERDVIDREDPLYNIIHTNGVRWQPSQRRTPSDTERAIYDAAVDVMSASGPTPYAREEIIAAIERGVYSATFDYLAHNGLPAPT